MRYAVLSDIHANQEALEAVLEDIQKQGIDTTYCLGDIIGYGPNPLECYQQIQEKADVIIKGNHEDYLKKHDLWENVAGIAKESWQAHMRQLGEKTKELTSLPLDKIIQTEKRQLTLVHANAYDPISYQYIGTGGEYEKLQVQLNMRTINKDDIIFAGHTHIPGIVKQNGENIHTRQIHIYGEQKTTRTAEKTFIDVGSVGQPRDRDWRACYVIYDEDQGTITWRRVQYNLGKTQAKIKLMPYKEKTIEFLCDRLAAGI